MSNLFYFLVCLMEIEVGITKDTNYMYGEKITKANNKKNINLNVNLFQKI